MTCPQLRFVVTWDKAERLLRNIAIWKDPHSVVHRLPEFYRRRYWLNLLHNQEAVHWRPFTEPYTWDYKWNVRRENENYPILVLYPPEADKGLWGGEGIVKGYRLSDIQRGKKRRQPRNWLPTYWFPKLMDRVLYSEILDKYMRVTVTQRTMGQIDKYYGLDFYLLQTPEPDLHSKLGCNLKRQLLLALARKQFGDRMKSEEIIEKYAQFIIPEEEAEWIGLDLNEACRKLQQREQLVKPEPLIDVYRRQMAEADVKRESKGIMGSLGRLIPGISSR
uniref:Large ribosomal subunit protein bL28m n=1 Tax=Trichuris muris TaxID=70415 RepID=A0A5S6QW95_TRIMR